MIQPPSGGCVLKQSVEIGNQSSNHPAAFGRLCVETLSVVIQVQAVVPAAFGRLCVETDGCS